MMPPISWNRLRLISLETLLGESYALLNHLPHDNPTKSFLKSKIIDYQNEYFQRAGKPYIPPPQENPDGWEGDLYNQNG